MANDHNHITITGRLGADPEVRQTSAGGITSLRVAVGWKSKATDGTDWFSVSIFGKLGEVAAQYLRKGSQVLLAGRMRSRQYEKDGAKITAWELIATDMQMLGDRQSREAPPSRPEPQRGGGSAPAGGAPDFDDDIPFAPRHWLEG